MADINVKLAQPRLTENPADVFTGGQKHLSAIPTPVLLIAGQIPPNETSARLKNAYVTVLYGADIINKQYYVDLTTRIVQKMLKQKQFYDGYAVCYYIPNIEALHKLILEISNNPKAALVLGYHPGAIIGQAYSIYRHKGVIEPGLADGSIIPDHINSSCWYIDTKTNQRITSRTKDNMVQSNYACFDKDEGEETFEQWLESMERVQPELKNIKGFKVQSNSSRVGLVAEDKKIHYYVEVKDPPDLINYGNRFLSKANSIGLVFTKKTKNDKTLSKTIIDIIIFQSNHILYEGLPTIHGYQTPPAKITTYFDRPNQMLDTSAVKEVEGFGDFKNKLQSVRQSDGSTKNRMVSSNISIDKGTLKLDTHIQINGCNQPVTPQQLIDNPKLFEQHGDTTGKVRCQIPSIIRDSTSMNGILRLGNDGMPLLIDNGTGVKYVLSDNDIAGIIFTGGNLPVQLPAQSSIEGEYLPTTGTLPPPIDEKPRFFTLPNDYYSYENSAKEIFSVIADTFTLFVNSGGLIVKKSSDNKLEPVTPVLFQSEIESYCGTTMAYVKDGSKLYLKEKRLSVDKSKTLLESTTTREALHNIKAVSACPVITPDGVILNQGYHNHNGGILITHGGEVPDILINDAVYHLLNLYKDFNFTTPGDKSRAIAMILTPAFKHSGLIKTVCPVDIGEADDSQSGKTYRQKVNAAVYNNNPSIIAEKKGGVGSLDESISKKIIEGQPFILLDNLRGRLDSPLLEAIITSPESAPCRVPHKGEVTIDASLTTFQITSNGVDITRDMANRSCVTRIRKQPNNYQWHNWEGDELLEHVFKYQPYYLGCVFSIAREWIRQGKPEVSVVDHDMRGWAKPMEWIIQNIFDLPPMLEGYTQIKEMVSNPRLAWLRQICLSAQNDNLLNRELYAHQIVEIAIDDEIKWPNGRKQYDNKIDATMAVGNFMKKIFNDKDEIIIDSFKVTRVCHDEYNQETRMTRNVKNYMISPLAV